MKNQYAAKQNFIVEHDLIHVFFSLLRHGFMVETQVDCRIKTVLCNVLDLGDNYVEDRIKTFFLDAKPVDDISTASVSDGPVLELSGAMPGLAGATLRRGGRLAFLERCLNKQDTNISYLPYFNLLETADNSKKAGLWKSQKIF